MYHNFRYIVLLSIIFLGLLLGKGASAQIYHNEVSFKDSLIQMLFQYGREVYYRGLDPQEASYVFQRILTLDCDHIGAQEFLDKIHEKYPDITIRIQGCVEDVQPDIPSTAPVLKTKKKTIVPTLREERMHSANNLNINDDDALDAEEHVNNEIINRSTPLFAYSKPILVGSNLTEGTNEVADSNIATSIKSTPLGGDETDLVVSTDPSTFSQVLTKDCEQLHNKNIELNKEITALESQISEKDVIITDMQSQLAQYRDRDSASYAAIANDQRDLIRIQQGNIDYLQKELDDVKEQMLLSDHESDPARVAMHKEIANSQLLAKEKEMHLEAKNREAQLLQKQLGEMQEQLQLVKKILSEKNEIINSLRDELESIKLESGN